MKKPYLLSALLLSGLMLAGCGNEDKVPDIGPNGEDSTEQTSKISINVESSVLNDGHVSEAQDDLCYANLKAGTVISEIGQEAEITVTMPDGYDILYIKINGVDVAKDTRKFIVEQENTTVDILFYEKAHTTAVDFKFPTKWAENGCNEFNSASKAKEFKDQYFTAPIFDQTQTLNPVGLFGFSKGDKDKLPNYPRFGSNKSPDGKLEIKLDTSKYTKINRVYVEAIPYTSFTKLNDETNKPEAVFEQETVSFTIDGTNYKDVEPTKGTNVKDIQSSIVVYEEADCTALTDKITLGSAASKVEEERTEKHRVWIKSLWICAE